MSKILKKYTSIPQNLYVERSADAQLRNIIEEMQRPGYVLVARQMGKTNLLFNAKRNLENKNRLFVYVDLSNLFLSERECYRNIIDCIIEPNYELFASISNSIAELRTIELPAHKEYSRSLLQILSLFSGDIVLILDEIDALRSVEYSDNIFAQIRSTYFQRTNFTDLERITYILSGVIDPIDLIKDRNKSPFNIGEKIYLDDFNKLEHLDFIRKSELNLDEAICEEIFAWTNGNPRLTYDICSTIEDILLSSSSDFSKNDLDKIVHEKYLTNYDIAPIDHIRDLIKSDKSARQAVLNIQRNRSEHISDDVKQKLYLYGIINSKFDEKLVIKNKIIRLSLTERWIKSIDSQNQDGFFYALEKINELEFREAIELLHEYIKKSSLNKQQLELSNYYLGYSHFKLREYSESLSFFEKEYFEELFKRNARLFEGSCNIELGRVNNGVKILDELIASGKNDLAYRSAILNKALHLINECPDDALLLLDKLIQATSEENADANNDELSNLKTIAYYYKSDIYSQESNDELALENINLALGCSNISDSLYLTLLKHSYIKEENWNYFNYITETIIENKLHFDTQYDYPINFTERHLGLYLSILFSNKHFELLDKLVKYAELEIYAEKKSIPQILYKTSKYSPSVQKDILLYALNNYENMSIETKQDIYRELIFIENKFSKDFKDYFNAFNKLFLDNSIVTEDDITAYLISVKQFSDNKYLDQALYCCDIIKITIENSTDERIQLAVFMAYYWYSFIYHTRKDYISALVYAEKAIESIQSSEDEIRLLYSDSKYDHVVEHMNNNILDSKINMKLRNLTKVGRNDFVSVKYLDGTLLTNVKYKKVETDLRNNICMLLI